MKIAIMSNNNAETKDIISNNKLNYTQAVFFKISF